MRTERPPARPVMVLAAAGALLAVTACGAAGDERGELGARETAVGTPLVTEEAGSLDPGEAATAPPTVVPTPVEVHGVVINYHGTRTVTGQDSTMVELYDYYFEPSVLIGSPGQRLTVTLVNEGEVRHTFTLEKKGVDVFLRPGESVTTTVTFPETDDRAAFVCRFHLSSGMAGILVAKG